ncbi:MAG TPA: alpha/beta hydrolase-fold protein [bacterium]|nr:alpha/beta hydrolase-fold protein [bacterium]
MEAGTMWYRILLLVLGMGWGHACLSQRPITAGRVEVIHSRILDEARTCQISLPSSYAWAPDRRYPVLYLLDGEANFLHTAGSVGFLSSTGEIPELIIVAITSTVRIRDFTQTDWSSHWIGGGGASHFKSFLSRELIPDIEKKYRSNGFRILFGHSAAGQFVLYTMTAEPSLFNAYAALSPSLDWDDNLPQRSLAESFAQTDSLKAFLYFAWSDDSGQALAADQGLLETLKSRSPGGFRWAAKAFPDETHMSMPLLAQIDALRQLFCGYRFHDDLLDKGFAFAEQHFQMVSQTVGYAIPVPEEIINNFGYNELDKGHFQEAIAFFRRNVQQNPNSANAFDGLADGYEKAGMWHEAIAASAKAVELAKKYHAPDPDYYSAHAKKIRARSKANADMQIKP